MKARSWLAAAALVAWVAQAPATHPAQERKPMTSLSGKTIRWTFVDGPTAGTTFEHTLDPDGSITWRAIDGAYKGASRREKAYGAAKIGDEVWVVSYLAESGHTLTVVLNFANRRATAFASDDKTWDQLSGTFELLDWPGVTSPRRRARGSGCAARCPDASDPASAWRPRPPRERAAGRDRSAAGPGR